MAEWFYARNNKRAGPVSEADLKGLAADGTLSPKDLVWTEGMAEWTRAEKVNELFPQDSRARPAATSAATEALWAGRPGRKLTTSRDEEQRRPRRSVDDDDDNDDDDGPRRGRGDDDRPLCAAGRKATAPAKL